MLKLRETAALCLLAALLAASSLPALAAPKQAENDGKATFDAGTFILPDLANPKDTYTIVIVSGEKTTKLALPAGATAMRFTAAALPSGEWKWRYVLLRASLPQLEVVQPKQERFTFIELAQYDNAVLLVWKADPRAATYKITVATDQETDLTKSPDWGKEVSQDVPEDGFNPSCNCVHYAWNAKPGTRLKWKATAFANDDTAVAESDFHMVSVDEPWSAELHKKGYRLQRSDTLSPTVAGKPALFGYQSSQAGGEERKSAYSTEFAIVWEDPDATKEGKTFYGRASVEARLTSSGAAKSNDAFRLRAGGYKLLTDAPLNLTGNLKYDTEFKTGTKKGSLELMATPTFPPFGRSYPSPRSDTADVAGNFSVLPWVQFTPNLVLGGEVGRTFDAGTSEEKGRSLSRARVDLRLDARLNLIAAALRVPNVIVYGQTTYWRLGHQVNDEFTYSRAGASFALTKDVSLEFTYTVGHDAPNFGFARSTAVSLGVLIP